MKWLPFSLLTLAVVSAEELFAVEATVMSTIAGGFERTQICSGELALETVLSSFVSGLASLPDGSVLFSNYDDPAGFICQLHADGTVTRWAGASIQAVQSNPDDTSADGIPAIDAALWNPDSLLFDGYLNALLYAEAIPAGRVRAIDSNGVVTSLVGDRQSPPCDGYPGECGDGGPALAAHLDIPTALARVPWDAPNEHAGALFIAEIGGQRIRRVDIVTGNITTVIGGGPLCNISIPFIPPEATPAFWYCLQLSPDSSLAAARSGELFFVIGEFDNYVRKWSPDNGMVVAYAGSGWNAGFYGNGGPVVQALFNGISAIVFLADESLLVSERGNSWIRRVNMSSGIVDLVAGDRQRIPSFNASEPAPATSTSLFHVVNMAVSASAPHQLLLVDDFNQGPESCVRMINLDAGTIALVIGYHNGDGGPAVRAAVREPSGIALTNSVIFPDPVVRIGLDGVPISTVYFVDTVTSQTSPSNQIRRIEDGVIVTVGGTGDELDVVGVGSSLVTGISQAGSIVWRNDSTLIFYSSLLPSLKTLSLPQQHIEVYYIHALIQTAIVVDREGNVYGADRLGRADVDLTQQLFKVTPEGTISLFAGVGGYGRPTGVDGSLALNARLGYTTFAAMTPDQTYYFVEQNFRVRKVVISDGTIWLVAGSGASVYSGDGGPATQAGFGLLSGIAVTADHQVYLADRTNFVIRKVDAGGIVNTVIGSGRYGFAGDGGLGAVAWISDIQSMALDAQNALYFSDVSNRRVRKATPVATVGVSLLANGLSQLIAGVQPVVVSIANKGTVGTRGSLTLVLSSTAGLSIQSLDADADWTCMQRSDASANSTSWNCSRNAALTAMAAVTLVAHVSVSQTALGLESMQVDVPPSNALGFVMETNPMFVTFPIVLRQSAPSTGRSDESVVLIAGLVVSLGVAASMTGCAFFVRRRRERRLKWIRAGRVAMISLSDSRMTPITEIQYEDIKFVSVIGEGVSSVVYKSTWRGADVAIKLFKDQSGSTETLAAFQNEMAMNSILGNHPRVVQFLGGCLKAPHVFMAFNYLPLGSIEKVLIHERRFPINQHVPAYELLTNLRLVTQMLVHAASGLLHVHACRVVHRDVGARNFLVDQYQHVTICDFGLSRALAEGQSAGQEKQALLPLKWCAPETLLHGVFSEQSDVFAFGVFIFECSARSNPYPGRSTAEIAPLVHDEANPLRPSIPPVCPREWARLMQDCWAHRPEDRPIMQAVYDRLRAFLLQVYDAGDDGNGLARVYRPFGLDGSVSDAAVVPSGSPWHADAASGGGSGLSRNAGIENAVATGGTGSALINERIQSREGQENKRYMEPKHGGSERKEGDERGEDSDSSYASYSSTLLSEYERYQRRTDSPT